MVKVPFSNSVVFNLICHWFSKNMVAFAQCSACIPLDKLSEAASKWNLSSHHSLPQLLPQGAYLEIPLHPDHNYLRVMIWSKLFSVLDQMLWDCSSTQSLHKDSGGPSSFHLFHGFLYLSSCTQNSERSSLQGTMLFIHHLYSMDS